MVKSDLNDIWMAQSSGNMMVGECLCSQRGARSSVRSFRWSVTRGCFDGEGARPWTGLCRRQVPGHERRSHG